MSSRGRQTRGSGGACGFIVAHPAEDLVADPAAQGADGLGLGVAHRPGAGRRTACPAHRALIWVMAIRWRATLSWRLPARLSRWRSVLPDQTGSGAVPLWRAKAARERKRPMPAVSPTSLAAVSGPQPTGLEQGRARGRRPGADLALEARRSWRSARGCGRPARGRSGRPCRVLGELRARGRRGRPPGRGCGRPARARVELVEVPAQAVLGPGALGDQVVAMVDQQAHLALGAVEGAPPAGRLAQGRPGDREGVDRVALAGLARLERRAPAMSLGGTRTTASPARSRSARGGGDRWRQSSSANAAPGKRAAQRTQLEVARPGRRHGLLGELATGLVGGHGGVRALVRIGADDDHVLRCLLIRGDTPDRPVDTPEWGRMPRSYEVTPAGPIHVRRPADPMEATPRGRASECTSQAAGPRQPDTQRECSRRSVTRPCRR